MKVEVKNLSNEVVRQLDLPDEVFGYPYKEHLIHVVVEGYRAGLRSGTHKVKNRGEVSGTNKKPFKQKGTGRARAGEARSPLWRKGGTVHGPVPHRYDKRVTVQEKKSALKSALSRKLQDEGLLVVDSFTLEGPKTKALAAQLAGLGIVGKALLVDDRDNHNLALAARNNPRLKAVDALGVNVYDVVDRGHLVLSEGALGRLVEVLSR
ncbi:MAG TPA: 50S ribosomal protein L4 [Thermoanaerobaculia bacterium]|jgi:large subunit ribosomal protein L4|nr:50S ribosomal protein L4 [Thermoanaerobaculia bacterium]